MKIAERIALGKDLVAEKPSKGYEQEVIVDLSGWREEQGLLTSAILRQSSQDFPEGAPIPDVIKIGSRIYVKASHHLHSLTH